MLSHRIPILLLKTKSVPNDSYEEYFSRPTSLFTPTFVPVLEHRPNARHLGHIKELLQKRELRAKYGGMIFTSQRAVEGFAQVVQELEAEENLIQSGEEKDVLGFMASDMGPTQSKHQTPSCPINATLTPIFPLYTVGPATSRTLTALLCSSPTVLAPLQMSILGSHTGNGEALAKYILEHYRALYPIPGLYQPGPNNEAQIIQTDNGDNDPVTLPPPPLLFLVGERRRDIIPKTLMSPALHGGQRIQVDELPVYETVVMESFPSNLDRALQSQRPQRSTHLDSKTTPQQCHDHSHKTAVTAVPEPATIVVFVIFSPSGCRELLRRIDSFDQDHPESPAAPTITSTKTTRGPPSAETSGSENTNGKMTRKRYVVATIGPTTYNYLVTEFGFRADVCAGRPSPEGVGEALEAFLRNDF